MREFQTNGSMSYTYFCSKKTIETMKDFFMNVDLSKKNLRQEIHCTNQQNWLEH